MSREGTIAFVDLDAGLVRYSSLPPRLRRLYIGGYGLNCYLAARHIPLDARPLGPKNAIIIGSSPLAGTGVPGSARLSVITKLPLHGAIAGCNGSMDFTAQMRWSGIDHLVITGAASAPCYLFLTEDGVELRDATELWGLDTYEATEVLWQRHGRSASVITMGVAGERLSPIALALVDKAATVGKGGLGAVMGAKKLKALIAKGAEPVSLADPKQFRQALGELSREMQADVDKDRLIGLATMAGWEGRGRLGFPYRNWSRLFSKTEATRLYGPKAYQNQVKLARGACLGCSLPDKEILRVPPDLTPGTGGCAGFTYASSFSGRAVNYGMRCGVGDAAHVAAAHDAANRASICDHHWTAAVDLAVDLQTRGVIGHRWKGAELLHEGYESTMMLMRMTIQREGIGTVLARGIPGLIQEFGDQAAQRAVHVEGIDMVFDPRAEGLGPKELAQIVSPRRHWVSGYTNPYRPGMDSADLFRAGRSVGLTEEHAARILPDPEHFHVGRLLPAIEDWYTVLSSVGICTRAVSKYFYPERVARLLSAITGDDWSETELMAAGRRSWDVLRALNGRVGIDQAQDKFPQRWLDEPLYGSDEKPYRIRELGPHGHELGADDTDAVLADYYDERGWNAASGLPPAPSAECEEREDW